MLKKLMAIVFVALSSVSLSNAGVIENVSSFNKKYAVSYNALQGLRDGAIFGTGDLIGSVTTIGRTRSFNYFSDIRFPLREWIKPVSFFVAIRNVISFVANEKYPGQKEDLKNTSSKAKYLLKKFGPEALYVASVFAGILTTGKCLKKLDSKFFA